jgi:hypothetical protein
MLDIFSPKDEDTAVIDPNHIVLKLPHPVVLGNNCRIFTMIFWNGTLQGIMITKADVSLVECKRFCNLK